MKRIIILEKTGDLLRQYWMLPELDYPEAPSILDKLIERLIKSEKIKVTKYDQEAKIRVIPWVWTEELVDEKGNYKPASQIFPYPRRNIKSEIELYRYNNWLLDDFSKIVMKLNNSVHLEPGWENINYKHISALNPIRVKLTQYELYSLEFQSFCTDGIPE